MLAPGARIVVRDAEWLVRRVDRTSTGGQAIRVVGVSELVRGREAIFLDEIERSIEVLDPVNTRLVQDASSAYQASLVYMESLLRQTPPTDENLYIGHRAAMDLVPFQLDPAMQALRQPRHRILIADAVGLGKTLEAGILLSELIRRGRGKRILVVAVKSMLTQFQKEMWSRFTIPLTRLDSTGIQRVRSRIPTNQNPFYYYDKAIISIDTLKQDTEYRTYLEDAYWDVIVIDEAHNVAERGFGLSLRSKLAKLLARRSDTLIMLSATPHDGRPRSFASLMNMLDPTAIANPDDYGPEDIKGLFIRRFKKDIQDQVEKAFKERRIEVVHCRASGAEEQVFDAFAEMSFTRIDQRKAAGELFKTTLEKVLGGAGTGKTVVAMHRARGLAKNVFTGENDRVLFTTFTRNLAADIRENLSKICSDEVLRRIEVVNLDKWVSDFLRRHGYRHEIDYGKKSSPLWEKALAMAPPDAFLPPSFYREEWERVIQPQGIDTLEQYLQASRIGRGVRLNRKERQSIWPVFEEYRLLLHEHGLREVDDAMRDATLLLEGKQSTLPYRSVIVDEAQDMGAQAFRLIRTVVGDGDGRNSIFIVGDGHQRIYRHRVVLGQCGINIRGRAKKLRINYRTTEETRRWAVRLLEGVTVDDLDGGIDDQKAYKSLIRGVNPTVKCFRSFAEEIQFIHDYLKNLQYQNVSPKEVCLVARKSDLLKQYEGSLSERGWKTYPIRRSEPEDRSHPGLRMATMHRVKGLEFDRVIIAGVNEGILPHKTGAVESADPVVKREAEWQERALLYVAATRARKEVLVTSFGKPSPFLKGV